MSSDGPPVAEASPPIEQDAVIIDIPLENKYGFSWPPAPHKAQTPPSSEKVAALGISSEDEDSASDSGYTKESTHRFQNPVASPTQHRTKSRHTTTTHPRMSRALSMPLPSQLGHLQHPHRTTPPSLHSRSEASTPGLSQFKELSLELADSAQMVIQTMLQLSPPQVLDPAKEHVSACALSIPTPSMSALFTAMKNLNYISANMTTFCREGSDEDEFKQNTPPSPSFHPPSDFDIGELIQNTGDALSGAAAHAGVDLALYHGDVSLKHVWVRGDENGFAYLLSHISRQLLATSKPGDSLELGLLVSTVEGGKEGEESLRCTIDITHKFAPPQPFEADSDQEGQTLRSEPMLSSLLLRRLLSKVGATFLPAPDGPSTARRWELTCTFHRGSSPPESPESTPGGPDISQEPTVQQLISFADTLRGRKIILHANPAGSFSRHLTSYLTAWGMDIIANEGNDPGIEMPRSPTMPYPPNPMASDKGEQTPSLSFIFIDDDVAMLKNRLQRLRAEQPYINISQRKRPSLTPHHRRSSPQINRSNTPAPPVVIVHFSSISNFKIVKDALQSVLASYAGTTIPVPEVMIILKPAGPRRILTALHTAITKPVVDPFFIPIATSPGTPGSYFSGSSFFANAAPSRTSSPQQTAVPSLHRPRGSRSSSDRSTQGPLDILDRATPSSPLAMADRAEYFTESSVQLGSSPSSGVVIQSPDGQPAGIFFYPKKGQRIASQPHPMERDNAQFLVSPPRQLNGDASSVSFSSLHEAAMAVAASKPTTRESETEKNGSDIVTQTISPNASGVVSVSRQDGSGSGPTPPSPITVNRQASANRTLIRRSTESSGSGSPAKLLSPPTSNAKKAKSSADGNVVPPIKVLIVDDNPINQTILSTFMRRKGIKYDVAGNGREAVDKWKSDEFHIILMDIQMPIMDGIEATKEIRGLEKHNATAGYPPRTPADNGRTPMARTPSDTSETTKSSSSPYRSSVIIVALTASSLQSDRVAALGAGCNDFLTKPVSLLWLNNKIIEWGSIKALQMWADPHTDLNMAKKQAEQARNVAERLHIAKSRKTPSPGPPAALNEMSPPATAVPRTAPLNSATAPSVASTSASTVSATSSMFWSPTQPSPATFWGHMGGQRSAPIPPQSGIPRSEDGTESHSATYSTSEMAESSSLSSSITEDGSTPSDIKLQGNPLVAPH